MKWTSNFEIQKDNPMKIGIGFIAVFFQKGPKRKCFTMILAHGDGCCLDDHWSIRK